MHAATHLWARPLSVAAVMLANMDLTTLLAVALAALVGLLVGIVLTWRHLRHDPQADRLAAALDHRAGDQAVLHEGLERLGDQMRDLEHNRVAWQSQFHEQVGDLRRMGEGLQHETRQLSTALRRPQVRGRWGEMHLRRAVEAAGLVDRCDFSEQVRLDDGAQRPDLVVHLAGGRSVVVDAKVPLEAFLDLTGSSEESERAEHLHRHARQLRTHIDTLASKAYWRALDNSPEFVVLFVPVESCLSAALESDPSLIEHAASRQVVLATPTTLIALLRTVAHGWSQEALTDQAQEILRIGRELHHRLGRLTGHLDEVGRALNRATERYNQAMGSLEHRVLVSARRFEELTPAGDPLVTPRSVTLRAVDRRGAATDEDDGHTVGA